LHEPHAESCQLRQVPDAARSASKSQPTNGLPPRASCRQRGPDRRPDAGRRDREHNAWTFAELFDDGDDHLLYLIHDQLQRAFLNS
jgi:hypothetical protein